MCDIALGLQEADLVAFAARVNASSMRQWRDLGLYDEEVEGWGQAFEQVLTRTLAAGGRVHFDLTGLNIADALAGDPGWWVDRHTAWELQQIVRHDAWFRRTLFYLNGKLLDPEELLQLSIRPHHESGET